MMQTEEQSIQIVSPFKDRSISFSVVGRENTQPVSNLISDEKDLISGRESHKWQEEYARGRLAARNALTKLGLKQQTPILKGPNGEPLWPTGYIGSISHSGGIGVACASKLGEYIGLGIDIENIKKKRHIRIFKKIATEKELKWIFEKEEEIQKRGVLVFSIKESIYKAVFQALKIKLKYMDAEVIPSFEESEAEIKIFHEELKSRKLISGFGFMDEFVVSGVGVLSSK